MTWALYNIWHISLISYVSAFQFILLQLLSFFSYVLAHLHSPTSLQPNNLKMNITVIKIHCLMKITSVIITLIVTVVVCCCCCCCWWCWEGGKTDVLHRMKMKKKLLWYIFTSFRSHSFVHFKDLSRFCFFTYLTSTIQHHADSAITS
jgi:hypothetical protein